MSRDKWNVINSWWILLTIIVFLYWAAFFYIGITAKYRKWIYYGIIYSIPFILAIVSGESIPIDSLENNLIYGSLFILWIVSIFHAFKLRKEYLIRLEMKNKYKTDSEKDLRKKIEQEYRIKQRKVPNHLKSPNHAINSSHDKNTKINTPIEPILVDINNDSEQAISKLPGVGIMLAKKAIKIRETRDFKTVEDFGQALGLKPHMIENIRQFVLINPSNRIFEPKESGRRVDF